jgi:hypothetical protein
MALQRAGLPPAAPGRTGPPRLEQSSRKFHAAGRFRSDDEETEVVFFFPRPVSAFGGHMSGKNHLTRFPASQTRDGRRGIWTAQTR